MKFCFLAVSEPSYQRDLQHGSDKKGLDEGAGMRTATRAICGTMQPVIIHKVMVIPFRKKPQTGINHSTRWFFGHPSLLDTPEVKSVPEPADSEQSTASSVSVSGNLGESHVDGTKATELISNDRPSTIVNQEEPCKNVAKAADSAGVLINSTPLEGYSEGVHTFIPLVIPVVCSSSFLREIWSQF